MNYADEPKLSDFWKSVDRQLARIRDEKPQTFDEVKMILDITEGGGHGDDAAFFMGGGGDDRLEDALHAAGWATIWSEASYYYVMRSAWGDDAELLTYIEGDVQRGNQSGATL